MALLITGAAGMADAAIACLCPEGRVAVEMALVCSCCHPVGTNGEEVSTTWTSDRPACDECVDVALRVPPFRTDSFQLQSVIDRTRGRATPNVGNAGSECDRVACCDHGHLHALALLSSVVLLT